MFPNINNMKIYLVCGKTDLRKGIDGLVALVTKAFSLDAYDNTIFCFAEHFPIVSRLFTETKRVRAVFAITLKTDAFSGREIKARSKR